VTLTGPGDYPPPHHMLRDLRIEFEHADESRVWMPAQRHLADARGHVRLGALATMVDVIGGGLAALAAAPGWIATADLSVHALNPVIADDRTTLVANARVLRAGRTTVVIECSIESEPAGGAVALATMTFSVLERRASNPVLTTPQIGGRSERQTMASNGSTLRRPLLDALGVQRPGPGVGELHLTPYVVNSLGSVQGGALATLAEYAAETLDEAGASATVDLQLAYLALAKGGPIRATASFAGAGDVVRVEIIDAGHALRTTTVALARLGRR